MGAVLLSPIYFLVGYLADENRGFLVFCVTGAFYGVVYLRWKISRKWVFIAVTVPLYLLQVAGVLLSPIPQNFPGYVMIPVAIGDAMLIDCLIGLAEKLTRKLS